MNAWRTMKDGDGKAWRITPTNASSASFPLPNPILWNQAAGGPLLTSPRFLARSGISFKTQMLYSVVFCTRYLDMFTETSLYRFMMKLFFIGSSLYILYLMKLRFR